MIAGEKYEVVKQIKLHTQPLRVARVPMVWLFVKETTKYYFFSEFRVRKANVY